RPRAILRPLTGKSQRSRENPERRSSPWPACVAAKASRGAALPPHIRKGYKSSAGFCPRQRRQWRAPCLEEEDAARGHLSRDEAAPLLREAIGATSARKGRGGSPVPQGDAQTARARGLLIKEISGKAAESGVS